MPAAHRPIPQSITLTAIFDTGADISCIDSLALAQIALLPRRAFLLIDASGVTDQQYQPAYSAGLKVLHPSGQPADNLVIPDFLPADLPLRMPGSQLLFGRDAPAHCRLDFDGRANLFLLEY